MSPKTCECLLCKPIPGTDPDPKHGFDRNKVPQMTCISCGKQIGSLEWEPVTNLARFGSMSFVHKNCDELEN